MRHIFGATSVFLIILFVAVLISNTNICAVLFAPGLYLGSGCLCLLAFLLISPNGATVCWLACQSASIAIVISTLIHALVANIWSNEFVIYGVEIFLCATLVGISVAFFNSLSKIAWPQAALCVSHAVVWHSLLVNVLAAMQYQARISILSEFSYLLAAIPVGWLIVYLLFLGRVSLR